MPPPDRLLVATGNPGKLSEFREILEPLGVTVVSLASYPDVPEVEEDADNLEGNARKKADALFGVSGIPTLADDTGLEVTALGGRPGVRSARYAGPSADAAANRAKLLHELDGATNRSARFRTVIALRDPAGIRFFEGVCPGRIIGQERGEGGFGYDALFVPDGFDQTFAEMASGTKHAISHRGRAMAAFVRTLREEGKR